MDHIPNTLNWSIVACLSVNTQQNGLDSSTDKALQLTTVGKMFIHDVNTNKWLNTNRHRNGILLGHVHSLYQTLLIDPK